MTEETPKEEPKSKTWRAWVAGIATTIIVPLAGYMAHAYNQYVEAQKTAKEISLGEEGTAFSMEDRREEIFVEEEPSGEGEDSSDSLMEQIRRRTRSSGPKQKASTAMPQQQVIKDDLQKATRAVQIAVDDQRWTIVLVAAATLEEVQKVKVQGTVQVYKKDGKFYLTSGVYPSKQAANRALISLRALTEVSYPYTVNLASWCPTTQDQKAVTVCSSEPTR